MGGTVAILLACAACAGGSYRYVPPAQAPSRVYVYTAPATVASVPPRVSEAEKAAGQPKIKFKAKGLPRLPQHCAWTIDKLPRSCTPEPRQFRNVYIACCK
jgi:hypothetical protein